nr:hypothetical protein [Tanacetum cinerariifolium]
MDEAYARKLHEELNQDINWDVAIEHVKQKAKEDPFVQRYQVMKKRPQREAQARRNMITYLKNTTGFRLDYFKGMSYDDIRPIFKVKFNADMEFLLKSKEQIEEEENRALESVMRLQLRKQQSKEDDDVYTQDTLLSRKVPVVDYQIIHLNNKPHYKIIRADGTHQLYVSFITLLKNFDREDLESLWSLVKERFFTSKPNNFSDDYLLTTLRAMSRKPDGQDNVWKSQRSVHGQAMIIIYYHSADFASRMEIPTFEVYIGSNAKRTLELMLPRNLNKNTKCFNAAGEELSVIKHKLMLLDTVAEGRVNTANQMVKFVFHLLDLSSGTVLLYQKLLEFNPGKLENTNSVCSNQRISPTVPTEPLKLKVFSPLHDDPYMEVMQAYVATNEIHIPPVQAPIASPTVMPPVLSLFDSQDFLPPEETSPPKVTKTPVESSISVSLSSSVGSSSPVRSITPPPDYPFDEFIFAELDNSFWILLKLLRSKPVPKKPNKLDAC